MLELMYRNKMQFFALAIFLVMSVILVMIPSASAEDHDVSITDDMKFNPEDLTINVEDTVTWTNNDGMGHTATSTDGPASFDSGNIAAGATWSFTFTEAGTYNYKCDYHSSMTGTVIVEADEEEEEDVPPRTDSDWFTWTMNGTHHSVLAITNESLNWTSSTVTVFHENGTYMPYSWYNAIEFDSDLEMNHTWYDDGTYFANITLYHNENILAYHNWTFVIESDDNGGDPNNETAPDGDNDGISDDDDSCPEEDASGHDADADGCIDDSDNDGVKNDVDVCPFDPDDACDAVAAPQNEGECVEGDVKNEDCNSCSCQSDSDGNWAWACTEKDCEAMKEDSPSIGFVVAVISCVLVATRKRN